MTKVTLIGFDEMVSTAMLPHLIHFMNKMGCYDNDFIITIIEARAFTCHKGNRYIASPHILVQSTDEEGASSICDIMSKFFKIDVIHQKNIEFFSGKKILRKAKKGQQRRF